MTPGETFTVPADADHPQLTVGRPDQLTVSLDGKALAPLGSGARPLKDVPIDPTALAARPAATAAPAATPAVTSSTAPVAASTPKPAPSPRAAEKPKAKPKPTPSPSRLPPPSGIY